MLGIQSRLLKNMMNKYSGDSKQLNSTRQRPFCGFQLSASKLLILVHEMLPAVFFFLWCWHFPLQTELCITSLCFGGFSMASSYIPKVCIPDSLKTRSLRDGHLFFLTWATPSSQPRMTCPRPSLKLNGFPRSREESNFSPFVSVPRSQWRQHFKYVKVCYRRERWRLSASNVRWRCIVRNPKSLSQLSHFLSIQLQLIIVIIICMKIIMIVIKVHWK